MKQLIASLLLLIAPTVYAQTVTTTTQTKKPFFFKAGLPLDDADNMPGTEMKYGANYYFPAAITLNPESLDFNVSAAFTYWYANQDAMDVAYIAPNDGVNQGYVIQQSSKYKPGFKVGVGYETAVDGWEMDAEYTWYDHTQSTKASVPNGTFFSASNWFTTGADLLANQVASSWKLNLNLLDLEGSRPYYEDRTYIVKSTGGLRFAWIKQGMDIAMTSTIPGVSSREFIGNTSSWAVGPKAGIKTDWMILRNLRIETMLGGSLLYTRYTTIQATQSTGIVTSVTSKGKETGMFKPTLEMGLGLGYVILVSDSVFLDIAARYDFMQFWSQNILREYTAQLTGEAGAIGDLSLQGLTFNITATF